MLTRRIIACLDVSDGMRDLLKLDIVVGMALYEERFTVAEALQC